jgi:membrane protease YdiL (CAAX protease family)
VLPLGLGFAAEEAIPSLPHPAAHDFAEFLDSATGRAFWDGNWTWLGLLLVMVVFNTVLGEELLFRGWLLPRMRGVFGRFDWVANGVLFATYHLHMPWVIPSVLLDAFWLAWPSRRFRSAWFGIAVHSLQSVVILVAVLLLVLGTG